MYSLLLVDDETSVVDTLAFTIPWKEAGVATIYTALGGAQAIELLKQHNVDIVITDIHMPGISGLEFVEYIHKHYKKTKCILLSGFADFQYAREAIHHHVSEYLLKPVSDEDLLHAVKRVIQLIREEWEIVTSYQNAIFALKENLPLLRGKLLVDVLYGRRYHEQTLNEKMRMLELPFFSKDEFSLILVRIDDGFSSYDEQSSSLLDFSITNIFEEMCGDQFNIWYTKDVHDYLLFLVNLKVNSNSVAGQAANEDHRQHLLVNAAIQLQNNVKTYLKGTISVVLSQTGTFPEDAKVRYQSSISEIRKRFGRDSELFITVKSDSEPVKIQTLQRLYEPPMLIHLLEAGLWDTAEQKLHDIFDELNEKLTDSLEHIREVFFAIAGALTYIAHKNGLLLEDLIGKDNRVLSEGAVYSVKQLYDWTMLVLSKLKENSDTEIKTSRISIVKQVHEFIENNLAKDVSLRAVADTVFLHPNYLSKIYRLETGEVLSEYIFRLRMERSAQMLKHSTDKIYEIAEKLGYQSPHYYIKVFKKYYGITPQEYREKTN